MILDEILRAMSRMHERDLVPVAIHLGPMQAGNLSHDLDKYFSSTEHPMKSLGPGRLCLLYGLPVILKYDYDGCVVVGTDPSNVRDKGKWVAD